MKIFLRSAAMRCFCLAASCMLLAPIPASARDLFVNNASGDDLHDGAQAATTAFGGPLRTLRRALELVLPGDRIVLAKTDEPYRESISLSTASQCGNQLGPLVIDGQGAVLDGTVPVGEREWESVRGPVFRFRPAKSSYQQLFLAGKPAVERALEPRSHKLPELAPLEWFRRDAEIYFRVEPDKLPGDYPLSYSGLQTGITLYHVHDVVIMDLIVQGFRLDGINVNDGVRNCQLIDVTCRGNGRSGVTVAGSSHARLDGCLLGDNGTAQLRSEGVSATSVAHSELLDNTAPPVVWRGGKLEIDGQPYVGGSRK
ncbi:MAG TPA: right-handed parallel beta-helix repeat-containing protein [Pirellulales bacterium]|nr:right-handed parallel beta-helix repeat-containing protein [Pirellulales bacterium]